MAAVRPSITHPLLTSWGWHSSDREIQFVSTPFKYKGACDDDRSDTMWLLRLGHKRRSSFSLVLLRHCSWNLPLCFEEGKQPERAPGRCCSWQSSCGPTCQMIPFTSCVYEWAFRWFQLTGAIPSILAIPAYALCRSQSLLNPTQIAGLWANKKDDCCLKPLSLGCFLMYQ